MIETAEKIGELKTVSVEKDTWILELPVEICRKEGFAVRNACQFDDKKQRNSSIFYQAAFKKITRNFQTSAQRESQTL